MRTDLKTFLKYILTVLAILLFGKLTYGQDNPEKDKMAEYEAEVRQIVSFLEFSMNVLGDPNVTAKDKDVIINESYAKIFLDEKVQIEDDLDENRDVVTNKDVQAYLKDVDFFFKEVKFEFNIIDVANDKNPEGQLFFTIKLMRNLKGITVEDDSINSDKERYIEVNVNEEDKDIKIASIYTTKLSRDEELTYWWADLDNEWKTLLGVDIEIREGLILSEIQEFSDSTYVIDDQQITDSIRIIDYVKIAAGKEAINLSGSKIITDLKPLDELKNLKKLDISSSDIVDLFPIRNLTTIEYLNCSNTMVENLNPLKYSKSLKELFLSNTPVTSIMVIENFSQLETLHLEQTVIDSLPSIDKLVNLKELNCASTNLVTLDSIKYLKSLEIIDFSKTSVEHLEPISNLEHLKEIVLNETSVVTLEPLKASTSIEVLNFENTKIDDLNALSGIKSLKTIYADDSGIDMEDFINFNKVNPEVDIIFISDELFEFWEDLDAAWDQVIETKLNFPDTISRKQIHEILKIKELSVKGNSEIVGLHPLKYMPMLESLDISNTSISDLTPIKSLGSLKILNGSASKVDDLLPLKELVSLQNINFEHTEINDISSLAGLLQIDTLRFSDTKVKDVSALNEMENFNIAYFENSLVTDEDVVGLSYDENSSNVIYKTEKLRAWWGNMDDEWQNIFRTSNNLSTRPSSEELHQLAGKRAIDVESTKLSNLGPISEFIRLQKLSFADSHITSLYSLVSIKRLEELRCPRNPISDIEALSSLKKLKVLDLENTQIKDLNPIRSLTDLRELKFSGTNVKDLSPVSRLENLEVLEFSKTRIKQIKALSNLENLKVLKCYNNKIQAKRIEEFKAKNPECDVVFY